MTYTRVSGSPVLTSSAACSASRSKSATRSSSSVKIRIRPYGRAGVAADDPPALTCGPDSAPARSASSRRPPTSRRPPESRRPPRSGTPSRSRGAPSSRGAPIGRVACAPGRRSSAEGSPDRSPPCGSCHSGIPGCGPEFARLTWSRPWAERTAGPAPGTSPVPRGPPGPGGPPVPGAPARSP